MKKLIIVLFVMAAYISTYAQNNCNCSKTLEQLINKVENEYPGFGNYTKDTLAYINFKNHLIELSKSTSRMGLFLLTGSQQFGLMSGITQSLAGRTAFVELLPFSVPELAFAEQVTE